MYVVHVYIIMSDTAYAIRISEKTGLRLRTSVLDMEENVIW